MPDLSIRLLPEFGAGEESRTLDLNLGKVALYQLSYSRFTAYRPCVHDLTVHLSTINEVQEYSISPYPYVKPASPCACCRRCRLDL